MQRPYSSSPDSQYLVMLSEDRVSTSFQIFNVQNGAFRELEVNGGWDDFYPLRWSPDGRWISYSARSSSEDHSLDIFIMPVDGGSAIRLLEGENDLLVSNWLTVPFQIGDVLIIMEAGANLNLRDAPSLDGPVLKKTTAK